MEYECKFCGEEFNCMKECKEHEDLCIITRKELECPDYDDPYRLCLYDFNF